MRQITPKVIASRADYIDPTGCDSIVAYKIVKGRRLYGEICLTDCSRKIEWYFHNDAGAIRKIDKAIALFTEFREKFKGARRRKTK